MNKVLSENLEREQEVRGRIQTARGVFQITDSLEETFEYFIERIKELEARVAILERKESEAGGE